MINRIFNHVSILDQKKSIFLFGPRGVGKSRLVNDMLATTSTTAIKIDLLKSTEQREFLKDPSQVYAVAEKALKNAEQLLLVIDEVQKVPALLDEVHRLIENFPGRIQCILTGSSARKLKSGGANLLAGRALTYRLHPFTSEEVEIDLSQVLQFGTLPISFFAKNPVPILRSYVDTYITQEIQQEALVRRLEPFIRFIELAAQFNGQPINYTRIAKQVGTTAKTVIEYFSILVDTLLVQRIDPWSYSVIQQLSQQPRFYLFDCGVLNALSGELRTELRPGTQRYGNLFETFVVNELVRFNDYHELGNRFFYLRTQNGLEVDLIISKGPRDTPRLVEIKSKSRPEHSDVANLIAAQKLLPAAKLFCVAPCERPFDIGEVSVLPWKEALHTLLE